MEWFPVAGAVALAYGLVAGFFLPVLIERIPEPEPEHGDLEGSRPAEPPKEPYADIAAAPGLRWWTAVATGTATALLAAAVGWSAELAMLMYLAPIGVALSLVDWRTRLLPTKVIAPSYGVVVVLALLAALVDSDTTGLVGAALGWLVAGGTFLLLWLVYPRGMGLGDVRLAGLLGIALGYLGWGELLVGVYAGFVLGAVGGGLLALLRIVDRKGYPFGPFMLLGAVVGVVLGPAVAGWYASSIR